jgi:hypothetical protein
VVGPVTHVRQRIRARNAYNPESPHKALRGSVPGWKGTFQPTVKHPGDLVIEESGNIYEIGVSEDEQPPRTPGTQKR